MRDALAHYIGLMQSNYEYDENPHVICIKTDYRTTLQEDSLLERDERKFGTFNRHYMEYSMYKFENYDCQFSRAKDYDHYKLQLPSKADYAKTMAEPVYFDYTSAVTKSHALQNPHLVSQVLQSRDWARLVSDWDLHYKNTLGDLMYYIDGDVMMYVHDINRNYPTMPQIIRLNQEIHNCWGLEAKKTKDAQSSEAVSTSSTNALSLMTAQAKRRADTNLAATIQRSKL